MLLKGLDKDLPINFTYFNQDDVLFNILNIKRLNSVFI